MPLFNFVLLSKFAAIYPHHDHVKLGGMDIPLHVESNKNQYARGQSRDPRSKLGPDKEGTLLTLTIFKSYQATKRKGKTINSCVGDN